MTSWASLATDVQWRNAWGVIPLAILVAAICRLARPRPATRHSLWMMVLICAIAPPLPNGLRPSFLNNSPAFVAQSDRSTAEAKPAKIIFLTGREGSDASSFENTVDFLKDARYASTYVEERPPTEDSRE